MIGASPYSLREQLAARLPADEVRAVVLAGGKGTRLAPYTTVLPKPLMPIGDRSILEVVFEQLLNHGISDITLCVGHLSHLIEAVLGDGSAYGISVNYVRESHGLGTAAPLRLIEDLDSTFIVMNGDVLTTLDYRALLRYHRERENLLTIASQKRRIKIDYGVLHVGSNGKRGRVRRFVEKPEVTSAVSMGIYVMEPAVLEYIPSEGYFDFPELVQALLAAGEPVGAYNYDGLWFDIGRREDYEQASEAWANALEAKETLTRQRRTDETSELATRLGLQSVSSPPSAARASRAKRVANVATGNGGAPVAAVDDDRIETGVPIWSKRRAELR